MGGGGLSLVVDFQTPVLQKKKKKKDFPNVSAIVAIQHFSKEEKERLSYTFYFLRQHLTM
jgi:hypothetical protein